MSRTPRPFAVGVGALLVTAAVVTAVAGSASGAGAINPTRVSLNCGEKRVIVRGTIECIASVTDTGPATSRTVPTGDVAFATDGRGAFSPASCTLEPVGAFSARCETAYAPTEIGDGSHAITASYAGTAAHAVSRSTVEVEVTPPNDELGRAPRLSVPGQAQGTTAGATSGDDPELCGEADGTVWYRLGRPRSGRVALELVARGRLDAALAALRRVRSRLVPLACTETNDRGRAAVSVVGTGADLVVAVGQLYDSPSGTFTLSASLIPPVRAPGQLLPRRGARSLLHPVRRPEEAWAIRLARGTTYRISVAATAGRCVDASVFRPGTRSFARAEPILRFRCGGYSLFTPGPDGGGRYSILVSLGSSSAMAPYRLIVARAGPDDTAPGIVLANSATARGVVSPGTGDVVDLYRFDVIERSDVTLDLRGKAGIRFTLAVHTDEGRRVACACRGASRAHQRLTLGEGTYYAAVRAHGSRAGGYALSLLVRRITTLDLSIGAADGTVARGSGVGVVATVSPGASGGVVRIQLDRLDPIAGWQFVRVQVVPVSGGTARLDWVPRTAGRFRLRAAFSGTREDSPSSTGYVHVRVT